MLLNRICKTESEPGVKIDTCGWWLCNPQYDTGDGYSTKVEMITAYGQYDVEPKDSKSYAVRPAMWVPGRVICSLLRNKREAKFSFDDICDVG